jgi:hypothetical protein
VAPLLLQLAEKGATAVTVDSNAQLAPGMWVRITMDNPAGDPWSLGRQLGLF